MSRSRGRPRAYDPEVALDAALHVFWVKGYDATTLEDLREATGMNRPSLYAAFGDKASIYRRVLERFEGRVRAAVGPILARDADLRQSLLDYYLAMIEVYAPVDEPELGRRGRGCLVMTTAGLLVGEQPAAARELSGALAQIDHALTGLIHRARQRGELSATADVDGLAWLASAVQHSLSVRARAGESVDDLASAAERAIDHIIAVADGTEPGDAEVRSVRYGPGHES